MKQVDKFGGAVADSPAVVSSLVRRSGKVPFAPTAQGAQMSTSMALPTQNRAIACFCNLPREVETLTW
jgi:hypothetical protein